MNKRNELLILTFVFWLSVPISLNAQVGSVAKLSHQLDDKSQEIKYLQQEIAFAQVRRKASDDKLKGYQKDLEEKQLELKSAELRYLTNPSVENEQLLRNAQQRIELVELSIKSRVASVVRLETKERELTETLELYESDLQKLSLDLGKASLTQKVEQKTESLKNELTTQTTVLQQRIDSLQRENERLLKVAQAESEKREIAEERTNLAEDRARSAELALAQIELSNASLPNGSELSDDIIAEETTVGARERAQQEMERLRSKIANGNSISAKSKTNLTLKGDDGTDYGLFQYLGAQQYRIDAVIRNTVSRFRVAGRMYQVKISESALGEEFIFLYDLSDRDNPRFVTFKKKLLDDTGAVAAE